MYPKNVTELAALLGVLLPIVVGLVAARTAAKTRAEEFDLVRWRRLHEVASTLYKGGTEGLWPQMAACAELGETKGSHRQAAIAILESARAWFAERADPNLRKAIDKALKRVERSWFKRLL